jgi:hypothetical protein
VVLAGDDLDGGRFGIWSLAFKTVVKPARASLSALS